MNKINQMAIDSASSYIMNNGRYLEKVLFGHYFIQPCSSKIVKALKMYQNKDGGYGNGIEPDFRMSYSSPMATSVALGMLAPFDNDPYAINQIKLAVRYLEDTFLDAIGGWEGTSKMVNLFPHAPWWHYKELDSRLQINPTVELVGYLIKYNEYVEKLNVQQLKDKYIDYIVENGIEEEHSLFCYIKFYNTLSDIEQDMIRPNLVHSYQLLVSTDPEEWHLYKPFPLKFIGLTEDSIFEVSDELLRANLNFLRDKISFVGHVSPTWTWGQYNEEWETAKREWSGILTLDALRLLKRFNYL
ncbi:MAG: hypothetical protein BGO41_13600 [Clostridiales bacterium 38-18]|nr:MAG: hypothetical protein BGO41_13600 [Clostridiales bacterium 38-18]